MSDNIQTTDICWGSLMRLYFEWNPPCHHLYLSSILFASKTVWEGNEAYASSVIVIQYSFIYEHSLLISAMCTCHGTCPIKREEITIHILSFYKYLINFTIAGKIWKLLIHFFLGNIQQSHIHFWRRLSLIFFPFIITYHYHQLGYTAQEIKCPWKLRQPPCNTAQKESI